MSGAGDGLVGGPVGAIASQELPGERGSAKIVKIGAGVGIPPIALVWHLSPPLSDYFPIRFILSRESQRHFADRASSGAGPTTTVVGSICGSHTTQARSAPRLGSAAKSQPPLVGHLFGYFSDCMSCAGDGLVGGPVGAIASQKLPGERGDAKIMEIGASVGIPPIALVWHLSNPGLFPIGSYYADLLKLWIARLSGDVECKRLDRYRCRNPPELIAWRLQ
jgi:hypothetical protein